MTFEQLIQEYKHILVVCDYHRESCYQFKNMCSKKGKLIKKAYGYKQCATMINGTEIRFACTRTKPEMLYGRSEYKFINFEAFEKIVDGDFKKEYGKGN